MDLRPPDAHKSYWIVNYDFGFVRRGLGGTILQAVGGDPLPPWIVSTAVWSTALVPVLAVAWLAILLARRGTGASVSLAILIACSPWVVDALVKNQRPDQYGLAWLVAVGVVFWRCRGRCRWVWLAILGVAGGALTLVHEASALLWLVVAIVLVAVRDEPAAGRVRYAFVLLLPALVALFAVLLAGRADPRLVDELLGQPSAHSILNDHQNGDPLYGGVIPHMGDTVGDSLAFVMGIPAWRMAAALVWGIVMFGVHLWWIRRWSTQALTGVFRRGLPLVAWLLVACAAAAVFLTGIDWLRWFCSYGTGLLVVAAFGLLEQSPSEKLPPARLQAFAAGAGVYLATRLPVGVDGPASLAWMVSWFI